MTLAISAPCRNAVVMPLRPAPDLPRFRPRDPEVPTIGATYATPHPHLCDHMPHRFFPVPKAFPLCIRCGMTQGRAA